MYTAVSDTGARGGALARDTAIHLFIDLRGGGPHAAAQVAPLLPYFARSLMFGMYCNLRTWLLRQHVWCKRGANKADFIHFFLSFFLHHYLQSTGSVFFLRMEHHRFRIQNFCAATDLMIFPIDKSSAGLSFGAAAVHASNAASVREP